MMKIDHLLLACRNTYLTSAQLREEGGLDSFEGVYLAGLGLAQRVVPLGNSQFIEIESVVDVYEAEQAERPISRHIMEVTREAPKFLSSYVLTDDFDGHAQRTGMTVRHPFMLHPNGETSTCRVAPRVDEALGSDLPIWFDMDRSNHPGDRPADHRVQPDGIAWMELGGDPEEIRAHIGPDGDELPLRLVGGEPGVRAVAVKLRDGGEVVIRPTAQRLVEV
jgi:hypothetical protein